MKTGAAVVRSSDMSVAAVGVVAHVDVAVVDLPSEAVFERLDDEVCHGGMDRYRVEHADLASLCVVDHAGEVTRQRQDRRPGTLLDHEGHLGHDRSELAENHTEGDRVAQ